MTCLIIHITGNMQITGCIVYSSTYEAYKQCPEDSFEYPGLPQALFSSTLVGILTSSLGIKPPVQYFLSHSGNSLCTLIVDIIVVSKT